VNRKKNNRGSFYGKNNFQKNTSEIKSVSTNINKVSDNKKKIINLPKIKLIKKENEKISIEKDKKSKSYTIIKANQENKIKKTPRTIIPYKLNELQNSSCLICNKVINNMTNAIFEKNTDKYYHFECITTELKKSNPIKPNQRIAYIGSNNFAIIEDIKEDGKLKFKIDQKLQYTFKIS
jgi:hypothetical protein